MKKVIKLSESQLVTLIKKIVKEQSVVSNPSECLKVHINFMFKKSVINGGEIVDGGDLALWNENNKIPDPSDKDAYDRFVELLKEYVDGIFFGFDECEGVTFEEIKPFIKDMYLAEIDKHNVENFGPLSKLTVIIGKDNVPRFRRDIDRKLIRTYLKIYNNIKKIPEYMFNDGNTSKFIKKFAELLVSDELLNLIPNSTPMKINKLSNLIGELYRDKILNYREKIIERYNEIINPTMSLVDVKSIVNSQAMSDSINRISGELPLHNYYHYDYPVNYWAEQVIDWALSENGIDLENVFFDEAIDYAKEVYGERLLTQNYG
jgi:hypothetical protein